MLGQRKKDRLGVVLQVSSGWKNRREDGAQAHGQAGELWGGPGKNLAAVIPVPRPSIPGMSSPNLRDRVVRASGGEEGSGGAWGHTCASVSASVP